MGELGLPYSFSAAEGSLRIQHLGCKEEQTMYRRPWKNSYGGNRGQRARGPFGLHRRVARLEKDVANLRTWRRNQQAVQRLRNRLAMERLKGRMILPRLSGRRFY